MINWLTGKYGLVKKVISILIAVVFFTFSLPVDSFSIVEVSEEVPFSLTEGAISAEGYAKLDPETFTIPAHLGEVKFSHKGEKDEVVVHIQDAHCNYFAQNKIADIIDYLNTEYGLKVINLEGGAGDYNLEVFTSISGDEIRREVSNYFVKTGEVNGAEFYAVNNPGRVDLWGVEDRDLYLANLKVYRDSLKHKQEVDKYLKELSHILNNLKRHIYTPELLKIDMAYGSYKAGNMSLRDYIDFLIDEARVNGVQIKSFPNVYLLAQAIKQEDRIDFNRANRERGVLVEELKKQLSKIEVRELVAKAIAFRTKRLSHRNFYEYLLAKAKEQGIDIQKFPALSGYIVYVSLFEAVDRFKVMGELDDLEEEIKKALYKNEIQVELNRLSRNLAILKNVFNLKLTKNDYEYYLENKSSFDVSNYLRFIEKEAPLYKVSARPSSGITKLDDYRDRISTFYEYSFERDDVFLKNLRFSETPEGKRSAVLITGGFHTENLCELLKKNDISYVSLMPRFTSEEDYESPYFALLAGQTANMQQMLSSALAESSLMQIASMLSGLGEDVWGKANIDAFSAAVFLITRAEKGETTRVRLAKGDLVVEKTSSGIQVRLEESFSPEAWSIERLQYEVHEEYIDSVIRTAFLEGKTPEADFGVRMRAADRIDEMARQLRSIDRAKAERLEEVASQIRSGEVSIKMVEADFGKDAHPGGRGIWINALVVENSAEVENKIVHEVVGAVTGDHEVAKDIEAGKEGALDTLAKAEFQKAPWEVEEEAERREMRRDYGAEGVIIEAADEEELSEAEKAKIEQSKEELLEALRNIKRSIIAGGATEVSARDLFRDLFAVLIRGRIETREQRRYLFSLVGPDYFEVEGTEEDRLSDDAFLEAVTFLETFIDAMISYSGKEGAVGAFILLSNIPQVAESEHFANRFKQFCVENGHGMGFAITTLYGKETLEELKRYFGEELEMFSMKYFSSSPMKDSVTLEKYLESLRLYEQKYGTEGAVMGLIRENPDHISAGWIIEAPKHLPKTNVDGVLIVNEAGLAPFFDGWANPLSMDLDKLPEEYTERFRAKPVPVARFMQVEMASSVSAEPNVINERVRQVVNHQRALVDANNAALELLGKYMGEINSENFAKILAHVDAMMVSYLKMAEVIENAGLGERWISRYRAEAERVKEIWEGRKAFFIKAVSLLDNEDLDKWWNEIEVEALINMSFLTSEEKTKYSAEMLTLHDVVVDAVESGIISIYEQDAFGNVIVDSEGNRIKKKINPRDLIGKIISNIRFGKYRQSDFRTVSTMHEFINYLHQESFRPLMDMKPPQELGGSLFTDIEVDISGRSPSDRRLVRLLDVGDKGGITSSTVSSEALSAFIEGFDYRQNHDAEVTAILVDNRLITDIILGAHSASITMDLADPDDGGGIWVDYSEWSERGENMIRVLYLERVAKKLGFKVEVIKPEKAGEHVIKVNIRYDKEAGARDMVDIKKAFTDIIKVLLFTRGMDYAIAGLGPDIALFEQGDEETVKMINDKIDNAVEMFFAQRKLTLDDFYVPGTVRSQADVLTGRDVRLQEPKISALTDVDARSVINRRLEELGIEDTIPDNIPFLTQEIIDRYVNEPIQRHLERGEIVWEEGRLVRKHDVTEELLKDLIEGRNVEMRMAAGFLEPVLGRIDFDVVSIIGEYLVKTGVMVTSTGPVVITVLQDPSDGSFVFARLTHPDQGVVSLDEVSKENLYKGQQAYMDEIISEDVREQIEAEAEMYTRKLRNRWKRTNIGGFVEFKGRGSSVGEGLRVLGKIALDKRKATEEESILMTESTTPEDDPHLSKFKGIITTTGGKNAHTSIVAREWGIVSLVLTGARRAEDGSGAWIVDLYEPSGKLRETEDGFMVARGVRKTPVRIEEGSEVVMDGATGQVFVRPPAYTGQQLKESDRDVLLGKAKKLRRVTAPSEKAVQPRAQRIDKFLYSFEELGKEDILTAGGKGANLGELYRIVSAISERVNTRIKGEVKMAVPWGFIVSSHMIKEFLRRVELLDEESGRRMTAHDLIVEIASKDSSELSDREKARRVEAVVREARNSPAGRWLREEIGKMLEGTERDLPGSWAVRSSSVAEDSAIAAFAGIGDTNLSVLTDDLFDYIARNIASVGTERSFEYRRRQGIPFQMEHAVVAQGLVDADIAGIVFGANAATGNRKEVVINSSWGMGEMVVSSKVDFDEFVIDKESGIIVEAKKGQKRTMQRPRTDGKTGLDEDMVDPEDREKYSLGRRWTRILTEVDKELEAFYGFPVDYEFAIKDGVLYILQVRPITTLVVVPEAEEELAPPELVEPEVRAEEAEEVAAEGASVEMVDSNLEIDAKLEKTDESREWDGWMDGIKETGTRILEETGGNLFNNEPAMLNIAISSIESGSPIAFVLSKATPVKSRLNGRFRVYKLGNITINVFADDVDVRGVNAGAEELKKEIEAFRSKWGDKSKGRIVTFMFNKDKTIEEGTYTVYMDGKDGETVTPVDACGLTGLALLNYFDRAEKAGGEEALPESFKRSASMNIARGLAAISGSFNTDDIEKIAKNLIRDGRIVSSGVLLVRIRPIDVNEIAEFYEASSEVMKSL